MLGSTESCRGPDSFHRGGGAVLGSVAQLCVQEARATPSLLQAPRMHTDFCMPKQRCGQTWRGGPKSESQRGLEGRSNPCRRRKTFPSLTTGPWHLEACGWRSEQAEFACQASLPGLAMPSLLPCGTHTLGLVAWGGTPGPQSSCCSFQTLFPWANLPVHFLTPPYSSHLPAPHTKVPGVPHQA